MDRTLPTRLTALGVRLLGLPVAAIILRLLRLTSLRAGIALVYHGIAASGGDPDRELVAPHGVDLFGAELRYLADGFRVVNAARLPEAAAGRRRGERFPVAITFDDDLASHVSLALPALRRRGVRATFFLTGATLHGPVSFWWERLQLACESDPARLVELAAAVGVDLRASRRSALHDIGRRIERLDPDRRETVLREAPHLADGDREAGLRADGVRALVDAGMSIGFHTRRHDYLPVLDDESLADAFEDGRFELEELAGERLTIVAYPHGAADERVARAARRAGFVSGYTGTPRAVLVEDDVLLLGRLEPSHRCTGHLALQMAMTLLRSLRKSTAETPSRSS